MSRKTIIETATAEIGVTENPDGSNRSKYGAWYGFDGNAWCAMFVSWVFDQAKHPLEKIDDAKGFRQCQSGYNHFKATNQLTARPQAGDIVLYDWTGDNHCDHTGIFLEWIVEGKTFKAIEGNTAKGNNSNGGKVMLRDDRKMGSVKAFVSPAVLGGAVVAVTETYTIGSAGSNVAAIQKMLYDLGYTIVVDGDYGNQTAKVVKQFQKENQLTQDGIVTPALKGMLQQALLKKEAPNTKLTTGSFLQKGATGAIVVTLQKALIKNKANIIADGVFGNETVTALKQFQQNKGLKADGIAGPETFKALGM